MKALYHHISAKAKLLTRDSRGVAAIIFAIVVPVLLIAVGAAININSIQNRQAELDAAVDSATINAATMYEQMQPDLETPSNAFFLANLSTSLQQQLLPNGNGFISMKSRFNQDGKLEVEGFAQAKVVLSFTSFIGMDDYTISRRTIARRSVEHNLVASIDIDSTASMCALSGTDASKLGIDPKTVAYPTNPDVASAIGQVKSLPSSSGAGILGSSSSSGGVKGSSGGGLGAGTSSSSGSGGIVGNGSGTGDLGSPMQYIPDPNCTKLEAAKTAAKHFVEKIHANVQFGDEPLISVVPFNFKANNSGKAFPASIENPESASPGFYSDLSDAMPLAPIVPFTKSKDEALSGIDAITSSFNAASWTRLTLPLQINGEAMDSAKQPYFGGETPPAWDDTATRIIVLLSDGGNVGAAFSNLSFDFSQYYLYLYKTDMIYQAKLCKDLKKPVAQGGAGAIIFTVLLGMDKGDFQDDESQNLTTAERDGFAWIERTMRDECASSPQFYFHVPVTEQVPGQLEDTLTKVYDQIAQFTYIATIVETDSHSKAPTF